MKNDEFIASGDTTKSFIGGQKLFGRYKLGRLLGRGGMGVVWLAHDEDLDREVALKFLPAMFINDRSSLDDLKRETRRSLELTHPNIVRTYDFVQDNEAAGISMEYVDADTLRNRRIDQPSGIFEPGTIGEWVIQLCDALDYAHRHAAIVHRDLKPANLMVNGKNQLKVADFGISRSLAESSTQVSGIRGVSGTLVYMSPQQLSGEDATALDDVYAVGATLYELCTTRPPFYTGDVAGQVYSRSAPTMAERRVALGVLGGEIPQNWETTIAACLAKDPAQRPQSAGEIASRLGLIDAATLNMPRPPSPASKSPPPIIRPANATPPPVPPPPPTPPSPPTGTVPWMFPLPAPGGKFPRPVLLSVLAAAFVIIVALVWHFGSQRPETQTSNASKPTADPKPVVPSQDDHSANARGSILLKTDPPEAIAQVGDAPPNTEAKPAVLSDVKVGQQTITIWLDGYETVRIPVEVTENQTTNVEPVKLIRSTGTLRIVSKPPNLAFELKSKSDPAFTKHGITTGATLSGLPIGAYEVAVTRENWETKPKLATVAKEGDPEVYFDFPNGNVHVTSDPPGAKVFLIGTEDQPGARSVLTGARTGQAGPAPGQTGDEPPQADTETPPPAKKLTSAQKKAAAAAAKKAAEAAEDAEDAEEATELAQAGTELGVTPLWREVPPGTAKFLFSLEGYEKAEVSVDVQAGAELPLPALKLKKTEKIVANHSQHRRRSRDDNDDNDDNGNVRGRGRGRGSTSEKVFNWIRLFRN